MKSSLAVKKAIAINAPRSLVWKALTSSEWTKRYMYGYEVESDWNSGSSISWKTTVGGRTQIRKGRVLSVQNERSLKFTDYNPDVDHDEDESSHAVITYELIGNDHTTDLRITDDCAGDEKKYQESSLFWSVVLPKLKETLEK